MTGTPLYIAPEVLTSTYGIECDIWSLGVCLFYFLTGKHPFDGNDMDDLFENIKVGYFQIPEGVSKAAKDLIEKMIEVDVEKRITAEKAL